MSLDFYSKSQNDVLFVVASGNESRYGELYRYRCKVLKEAIKQNCSAVICSEITLSYRLTFAEMNRMGKKLAKVLPKQVKCVIVCNEKVIDFINPLEVTCVQLGANIKFFTDLEKAMEWLLSEQ